MTITLNSFVIDHYRKLPALTVVSLIYTMISSVDILTANGVIFQSLVTTLFHMSVVVKWDELDRHHAVISYTLIAVISFTLIAVISYTLIAVISYTLIAVISYTLIAVSYRISIFNNLMLAVYRTVLILKPFNLHLNTSN
jgi:hypothetical protein